MLGFDDKETDYGLLNAQKPSLSTVVRSNARGIAGGVLSFAAVTWMVATFSSAAPRGSSPVVSLQSVSEQWHGVSLGGWLLMEINPARREYTSPMDLRPQWMFDQVFASSELDFITALRKDKGDDFAIKTMKNHWAGYITGDMLDAAKKLGVDTVRIPMGYWIADAPVGGGTPLDYGISPEGFVTGGLNHLLVMLKMLKERDMGALIDIHSMPCNSACISDGLYCAKPLGFMAKGEAPIGDMPRCEFASAKDGIDVYPTKRQPKEGMEEWPDVGVAAVDYLAHWIAHLPKEAQSVKVFQLANEPALGPSSPAVYAAILAFYDRSMKAARKHLPTLPLILSFMGPSKPVLEALTKANADDKAVGGGGYIGDHHYYLNWQACCGVGEGVPALNQMPWDEIHRRACLLEAEGDAHDIDVYGKAGLKVMVGEWSLATNLDAHMDITNAETRAQLKQLYEEQLETFATRDEIVGAFFWTLRMGSGWDPRPSGDHPHGQQLKDTSAWVSANGYPFKVWSLLEMAEAGIAGPLDANYAGTCAKNRCSGALGTCDIGWHPPPVDEEPLP